MEPCSSYRDDSRLVPSHWETSLQSNTVSHWLGIILKSALFYVMNIISFLVLTSSCLELHHHLASCMALHRLVGPVWPFNAPTACWWPCPPWRSDLDWLRTQVINTLRMRQNGRHFPNNIFKCIFLNRNVCILIDISLKFVPEGKIDNIPALVQIMAWRRSGEKPLSDPMLTQFTVEYMWH